jgi:hypothetical protein
MTSINSSPPDLSSSDSSDTDEKQKKTKQKVKEKKDIRNFDSLNSKIKSLDMYNNLLQRCNVATLVGTIDVNAVAIQVQVPKVNHLKMNCDAYANILVKLMELRVDDQELDIENSDEYLLQLTTSAMDVNFRFIWISEYVKRKLLNPADFNIYFQSQKSPNQMFITRENKQVMRRSIRDNALSAYKRFCETSMFQESRVTAVENSSVITSKLFDKKQHSKALASTNIAAEALASTHIDDQLPISVNVVENLSLSPEAANQFAKETTDTFNQVEKSIENVLKLLDKSSSDVNGDINFELPPMQQSNSSSHIRDGRGDINVYLFSCVEFLDPYLEELYQISQTLPPCIQKDQIFAVLNKISEYCLAIKIGYFTEALKNVSLLYLSYLLY